MKFILPYIGIILLTITLQAHPVTGLVNAVDKEHNKVTLDFEAPNTEHLTVSVAPGDAAILYAGERIHGQLTKEPTPFLSEIWPANYKDIERAKIINTSLAADMLDRRGQINRRIGEQSPPFALYNQNGDLFTHNNLKDKTTVLHFFFTRCQNPKMCPAAMNRMRELQKKVSEQGLKNIQFVSISIDPEFDTPGHLTMYMEENNILGGNYFCISGERDVIENLKRQFSIFSVEAGGTINHTMNTIILNTQAQIAYGVEGHKWTVDDFYKQLLRVSGQDKYPRI